MFRLGFSGGWLALGLMIHAQEPAGPVFVSGWNAAADESSACYLFRAAPEAGSLETEWRLDPPLLGSGLLTVRGDGRIWFRSSGLAVHPGDPSFEPAVQASAPLM